MIETVGELKEGSLSSLESFIGHERAAPYRVRRFVANLTEGAV